MDNHRIEDPFATLVGNPSITKNNNNNNKVHPSSNKISLLSTWDPQILRICTSQSKINLGYNWELDRAWACTLFVAFLLAIAIWNAAYDPPEWGILGHTPNWSTTKGSQRSRSPLFMDNETHQRISYLLVFEIHTIISKAKETAGSFAKDAMSIKHHVWINYWAT